jgi:hypothetical protein
MRMSTRPSPRARRGLRYRRRRAVTPMPWYGSSPGPPFRRLQPLLSSPPPRAGLLVRSITGSLSCPPASPPLVSVPSPAVRRLRAPLARWRLPSRWLFASSRLRIAPPQSSMHLDVSCPSFVLSSSLSSRSLSISHSDFSSSGSDRLPLSVRFLLCPHPPSPLTVPFPFLFSRPLSLSLLRGRGLENGNRVALFRKGGLGGGDRAESHVASQSWRWNPLPHREVMAAGTVFLPAQGSRRHCHVANSPPRVHGRHARRAVPTRPGKARRRVSATWAIRETGARRALAERFREAVGRRQGARREHTTKQVDPFFSNTGVDVGSSPRAGCPRHRGPSRDHGGARTGPTSIRTTSRRSRSTS